MLGNFHSFSPDFDNPLRLSDAVKNFYIPGKSVAFSVFVSFYTAVTSVVGSIKKEPH